MSAGRRSTLAVSLVALMALGAEFFLAVRPASAGGTFAVTLLVVDADGKPVAGAEAETVWIADKGTMTPYQGVVTGPNGRMSLTIDDWGAKRPLVVFTADRRLGCVTAAARADAGRW